MRLQYFRIDFIAGLVHMRLKTDTGERHALLFERRNQRQYDVPARAVLLKAVLIDVQRCVRIGGVGDAERFGNVVFTHGAVVYVVAVYSASGFVEGVIVGERLVHDVPDGDAAFKVSDDGADVAIHVLLNGLPLRERIC